VSRKSLFSAVTFGFLAIATTGCGGGEAPKPKTDAPQSSTSSSPAPAAAATTTPPNFSQPVVAGTNGTKEAEKIATEAAKPAGEVVAGLLPASDSDTVVRSTAKGRTDPFSGVAMTVVESKTVRTSTAPAINKASTLRSATKAITLSPISIPKSPGLTFANKPSNGMGAASVAANLAKKTGEPVNKKPGTSIALKPVPIPGTAPNKSTPEMTEGGGSVAIRNIPSEQAPMNIPQPELAKSILVSGVSEVNGQTQVIIKLPSESFSRYVSLGERLMDGKVLVKRVQDFSGANPMVILEEEGIEIPRKIGDKPEAAKDEAKK
jgi:hypothetical protein